MKQQILIYVYKNAVKIEHRGYLGGIITEEIREINNHSVAYKEMCKWCKDNVGRLNAFSIEWNVISYKNDTLSWPLN